MSKSFFNLLMGGKLKENSVIPSSAEPFQSVVTTAELVDNPSRVKDSSPSEPLIEPVTALIAPDATPNSLRPLSPSLVPDPVTSNVPKMPQPSGPAEVDSNVDSGAIAAILGINPSMYSDTSNMGEAESIAVGDALLESTKGRGMPEHKAPGGVPRSVMERWVYGRG